MFSPKYRLLITSKYFPEDGVIGLGTQLISIVNTIKTFLIPHLWYGADVEAVGKSKKKTSLNNIQPSKIGTDLEFIAYCSEIEQFIWGEFLCIDKNCSYQNMKDIELETEDKPFRSINAQGILLEIRAFDTTYFGIYAENRDLITKISKVYNASIEKIES